MLRYETDIPRSKFARNPYGYMVAIADEPITVPARTNLEYEYDIVRLDKRYHKCRLEVDGITYHLMLTEDELDIVRPI